VQARSAVCAPEAVMPVWLPRRAGRGSESDASASATDQQWSCETRELDQSVGSNTNTGISRSVFVWYSA
jgi:hypothetical protein